MFEKVAQSNTRFNAMDRLVFVSHSVRMPVGFGRTALRTKGRQLANMAHLKLSIIEVKAENNCLANALIIAIARMNKDPNYQSYRKGNKIRRVVATLLETAGIDLTNGGGIPELIKFQEHFHEYNIVVYDGLRCDSILFEGQVESSKRINLLFDDVNRHYYLITNLTGALAKRYVCRACNKGCSIGVRYMCDQTCSDCMTIPSCAFVGVRIPCGDCNRHFRGQSCYDNHKKQHLEADRMGKTVCEQKICCGKCGAFITEKKHDCNKRWCENCGENKEIGHLCFMRPLRNKLAACDRVLLLFYDFETPQDTKYSDSATVHFPNLVCLQQFCSKCENIQDINIDLNSAVGGNTRFGTIQ